MIKQKHAVFCISYTIPDEKKIRSIPQAMTLEEKKQDQSNPSHKNQMIAPISCPGCHMWNIH